MIINDRGRAIIKTAETLQVKAYLCPAGVPTIGYGHTDDVKMGDVITAHQAEAILEVDLDRFEKAVSKLAPKANGSQFSAMVSLAFNIGIKAFSTSTLLKEFLAGRPRSASAEFMKWTRAKVNGVSVELPGLVKRRAAEMALFLEVPS